MAAFFHPMRVVTGVAGGRAIGPLKRVVVRALYTHLAHRYRTDAWTTMNYGYAPLRGEAFDPPVPPQAGERYGLNLYWRVATSGRSGGDWRGMTVLEIGSGRGGGAAFIAEALGPTHMTGLDIAPSATALATQCYATIGNLAFVTGDAEALTLPDNSFDVALNIESVHCYARPERFLAEVAHVLKPGGQLLFAGFAARGAAYDRLVTLLAQSALTLERIDDITANIAASLAADEVRKRQFLDTHVRGPLKSFAVGAYALTGSPMRRAIDDGETAYIAAVLTKR